METTSYRLSPEIIADVERLADAKGITKSELVREALAEYVSRQAGVERKLDRVAALDAILGASPEGLGIPDLSERAEAYLRAGLGKSARPQPTRTSSTAAPRTKRRRSK
ncbi:MAG: ribbon-helix-helix protein, CopG family [Deltaproteobacteria bacterium]|nr:ribbon-helix-helix protein, CopG family [Deltaproteobacteria bacterium]